MRVLVLPLLVLAGCSDPFKPVDEGALWVLDASDGVFQFDGTYGKTSDLPMDGRGFPVGRELLDVILRRIKQGQEGPLRESERFSVPAGREVTADIEGVFALRFTAHPRAQSQMVDYRFAWAGGAPVEGRLDLPLRGVMGFLKPNGGKRYTLLLLALIEPR